MRVKIKYKLLAALLIIPLLSFGQTKKDTVIYNYIYKDTVIYNVTEESEASGWGIGPYAGIDYSYYPQWGGGFGYSVGFGVSYYLYRVPKKWKKKK